MQEQSVNSEIAFFGGSFTAIKTEYMLELLDTTSEYIDKFQGIRISTRPDCINDDILRLLKRYNVTSIELGAQSMDDDVLDANNRGHNAQAVRNASALIKQYGFSLGLQMMTGLYKSTPKKDIYTAEEFIKLNPDTVRIYPTVIMKNTLLEELYVHGDYMPNSLEQSVDLCAKLMLMFEQNNIKVIRLGLHHSESLDDNMICGGYHPAFKELCESKIFIENILEYIKTYNIACGEHVIYVSPKSVSKIIGQNKSNIIALKNLGYDVKIKTDSYLNKFDFRIE